MTDDQLRELVAYDYRQTSAKYGIVVRLPQDCTGIDALASESGRPEWARMLGEEQAANHFRRVYATNGPKWAHLRVELSAYSLKRFRKLGGKAA